jgi:transcription antitermination factor NusG
MATKDQSTIETKLKKGDIVMVTAGEFAGHYSKVKKIDRHGMVHIDIDAYLRTKNPIRGVTPMAKVQIYECEVRQAELCI